MGEDQCPLLRHQLVLLHPELLQQLPAGHREDGLEEAAPKDVGGLIAGQAVTALRHMAVAQPPGVVDLVGGHIIILGALTELGRCLQLPVVEAQQEHLGELIHGLALLGWQVAELVLHKIQDSLLNVWFLKRGAPQGPLDHRLAHLQDALPQQLEQVEIHLLGVRVLLLVHRHEEVLHIYHHAQQTVDLFL